MFDFVSVFDFRWSRSETIPWRTANLRTKILDFTGFDSSIIFILRGGILMSIGNFPESLSRAVLVESHDSEKGEVLLRGVGTLRYVSPPWCKLSCIFMSLSLYVYIYICTSTTTTTNDNTTNNNDTTTSSTTTSTTATTTTTTNDNDHN